MIRYTSLQKRWIGCWPFSMEGCIPKGPVKFFLNGSIHAYYATYASSLSRGFALVLQLLYKSQNLHGGCAKHCFLHYHHCSLWLHWSLLTPTMGLLRRIGYIPLYSSIELLSLTGCCGHRQRLLSRGEGCPDSLPHMLSIALICEYMWDCTLSHSS